MLAVNQTIRAITNEAHISLHSITSPPIMLERLAATDVIALDAAVSSGPMGARAWRLLANRQRVAPQRLPRLLIAAHNDTERQLAQQAATQLHAFADSVTILDERGRNETGYLRGLQGMGIKSISLNLEDAIPELDVLPRGSVVNWAELGGPVEEDPWFVDEQGNGSLVQTILDLSTECGIVAFFLTKGVYEPYLQLDGRLALLAISLNAPAISTVFEPGGAPPEERLKGLAWAIDNGAMDHTIRLGPIIPIEGYKRHYHELFEMMADILGPRLKRMTIDILRFSPQMPGILRASFPEEIVSSLLTEMEPAVKSHKYRPSAHRQQQFYHWIRAMLTHYGMSHVKTTPCKADPTEAFLFLRAGDITSMPCACHVSYQDRNRIQRKELPILPQQR